MVLQDLQLLVDGLAHYLTGILAQFGTMPAAWAFGKQISAPVLYFHHPQGGTKSSFFSNLGGIGLSIQRKANAEAHRLFFST